MNSNNIQYRYNVKKAKDVFQNLVSSEIALQVLAGMILNICECANKLNPFGWEVTLEDDSLCVNVGQIAMMIVGKKHGIPAGEVDFCCGLMAQGLNRRFKNNIKSKKKMYESVPVPGADLSLPISEVAKLTNREISLITQSQLTLVKEACERRHGLIKWYRSHSPAVINYFNQLCSREVPQPLYAKDDHLPMGVGDLGPNKVIEKAAIAHVTKRYHSMGYEVTSVESQKIGYDLQCTKDRSRRHLEVKGIKNVDTNVILTSGELKVALEDNRWWLVIVTNPTSDNPEMKQYIGKDLVKKFHLEPVAYRLSLK
ncbi:MAG: DUF3883 domain-containing protein [Acidobacteria bacterium]|nr:DUF3883 domain-containing protein [Acidobacteriota bacterium]